MEHLGQAEKIFGMKIILGRIKKELRLSQKKHMKNFLERYNMGMANVVVSSLAVFNDHYLWSLKRTFSNHLVVAKTLSDHISW